MSTPAYIFSPIIATMSNKWFFGRYIERLLSEKGWKPAELSRRTGLSRAYISHLLNGATSERPNPPAPSLDVIISLAKVFRLPEAYFIAAYKGIDPEVMYSQEADPVKAAKDDMDYLLGRLFEAYQKKQDPKA